MSLRIEVDYRPIKSVYTTSPDLWYDVGVNATQINRYFEDGCWNYAVYRGDWLWVRVLGRQVVSVGYGDGPDEMPNTLL